MAVADTREERVQEVAEKHRIHAVTVSLETSWLAHIPEPETISCAILGDPGRWILAQWCGGYGPKSQAGRCYPGPTAGTGTWSLVEEFAHAVVNGKPSPVPPEESLATIRILNGVYRSQREGREVLL